jgi:hypothetical protein
MIKEIPQAALDVKDQLQELVHPYEFAVWVLNHILEKNEGFGNEIPLTVS